LPDISVLSPSSNDVKNPLQISAASLRRSHGDGTIIGSEGEHGAIGVDLYVLSRPEAFARGAPSLVEGQL